MLLLSRFNWHNRVGAFRGAVWLHVLVILADRGVSLGGREDNADIRAWIDRFGSLGHGAASYDQWLNNARPRDSSGQPRIFYRGVLLDVHEWSEASAGCSSTMTDILGALFKGWT